MLSPFLQNDRELWVKAGQRVWENTDHPPPQGAPDDGVTGPALGHHHLME